MREGRLESAQGELAWSTTGRGPAVVLLAGLGSTRRVWGDLPRILARHHTVIAIDNRGVGGSRDAGRFTLEGAADDVAAVLQAEGRPLAALLGASMGGVIALETAVRHPTLVAGLVLASCAVRSTVHGRRVLSALHDLIAHLPPERVGQALMTLAFAPPCTARFPQLVAQAAAGYGLAPADRPGALAQADHLLQGWDLRRQIAAVGVPALVLAGRRDPLVAVEDTRELARCLPSARLLEVPDAGHSVLAEGGREVLDEVLSFLRSTSAHRPPEPHG